MLNIPIAGNKGRGPRAKICYVCGRQTLIAGYDYHVQQCSELFVKREELKPKKERRILPQNPFNFSDNLCKSLPTSQKELDIYNNASMAMYNSTLVNCNNCNRKFLPEKLIIHNKSCTEMRPARGIQTSLNNTTPSINNDVSVKSTSKANMFTNQTSFNNNVDNISSSLVPANWQQCASCGRTFNEIAYNKHVKICKKVFVNKRKPFDSAKHRIQGTDLEMFKQTNKVSRGSSTQGLNTIKQNTLRKNGTMPLTSSNDSEGAASNSRWRQESQNFREAMKLARKVKFYQQKAVETGVPLASIMPSRLVDSNHQDPVYDSYITCPTCKRKYSQQAGARHMQHCKNILAKPKSLVKGSGRVSTTYGY